MPKGISPLVATVLVILISAVGVSVVVLVGAPILDRVSDSNTINEAQSNMRILDDLIRQAASESPGIVRTVQISLSGGLLKINTESGTLDYDYSLKSSLLPKGTFKKDGNLLTIVGGTASASQNSTNLKIENEILEIVFDRTGNNTNFAGINTSSVIRTITLKNTNATIIPNDTSIILQSLRNTSWGLGYSELVREGSVLARSEVRVHVRSNLTNHEYDVFYTLPGSSDFFLINVKNVSTANTTTSVFTYKIGATGRTSDKITIGANETTFTNSTLPAPTCYSKSSLSSLFMCSYDNSEFASSKASSLMYTGDPSVFSSMCNDAVTDSYTFNLSVTGPVKALFAFTNGVCTDIGNRTNILKRQNIPSGSFGIFDLRGTTNLQLLLQYERIRLSGDVISPSGTYRVCVKNIGQDGGIVLVNVTAC